jgi:hypothetical protein
MFAQGNPLVTYSGQGYPIGSAHMGQSSRFAVKLLNTNTTWRATPSRAFTASRFHPHDNHYQRHHSAHLRTLTGSNFRHRRTRHA